MSTKIQETSQTGLNNVLDDSTEAPALDSNEVQKTSNSLCLLLRSQTPRFYLSKKEYLNGEKTVCIGAYPEHKPTNLKPREFGEPLVQYGLKRNQGSDIRRCVRMMFHVDPNHLKFLTLTFDIIPPDSVAKKILDRFLERLRRYLGKNFHYVWVAEKQKRGAIHFHLVLIDFIPIEVIRKKWEAVVHKWEATQGYTDARSLQINIKPIYNEDGIQTYLTKAFHKVGGYMTKDENKKDIQPIEGNIWSCSSITRKLLKAEKTKIQSNDFEMLCDAYNDIANDHLDSKIFEHKIDGTNTKVMFIPAPSITPEQQTEAPAPLVAPTVAPKEQTEAPAPAYVLTPVFQNTSEYINGLVLESLWGD